MIGIRISQQSEKIFKLFTAITILSFLSDMATITIVNGNNYAFLNIYGFIEFLLIGAAFNQIFNAKIIHRSFLTISVLVYLILFIQNPHEFNDLGRAIEASYTLVFSLGYFYTIYSKSLNLFIEKSPLFWLVAGLFVYFSGSLFSFLLSSEILDQKIISPEYSWTFHNMANIAKNLFFGVGFWLFTRKNVYGKK